MNGYTPQSPEVNRTMTPPSIGRRISVVDFSIRQVVMSTDAVYRKAINNRAKEQPVYTSNATTVANSIRLETAPVIKDNSSHNQLSSIIQFPIPDTDASVSSQTAETGEVLDMDQYRMANEARQMIDQARGDGYVAA